jgi:hypothetical protein
MKINQEYKPMSKDEIDSLRLKAYLSFDEEKSLVVSTENGFYRNRLGRLMHCRVILRRENGEIVVENENGCRLCLTDDSFFSSSIYESIHDFCRARNLGNVFRNGSEPTPRVKFIMNLLEREGIPYEVDRFRSGGHYCYNVILRGTGSRMVTAHHDIVNPNIDNANDNSASVINAIAIKKRLPEVNVVLLDGEEMGGMGSQRCADQINAGEFGEIEWVLNLELTGVGGHRFFIGNYPGKLSDLILEKFNCPVVSTPFNDSVIFRSNGIDSVVINPLPPTRNGKSSQVKWTDGTYLDFSLLYNCHSSRDTLETISTGDMQEFVEEVVIKILKPEAGTKERT